MIHLHISQDGVSRSETRSDFLLSTLRSYVEAMVGKLRLVADAVGPMQWEDGYETSAVSVLMLVTGAVALPAVSNVANAQTYPAKSMRMIGSRQVVPAPAATAATSGLPTVSIVLN